MPPVSEAMFLGGVLNAVKGIAGKVAGAVAKAAPKVLNAAKQAAPAILEAAVGQPSAAGGEGGVAGMIGTLLPQLAGAVGAALPQLNGETDPAQVTALLTQLLQTANGGPATGAPGSNGQPAVDSGQVAALLAGLLKQPESAESAASGVPVSAAPSVISGAPPAAPPTTRSVAPQARQAPAAPRSRSVTASRRPVSRARSMALSAPNLEAGTYNFAALLEQDYPYLDDIVPPKQGYLGEYGLFSPNGTYTTAYGGFDATEDITETDDSFPVSEAKYYDDYRNAYGFSLGADDSALEMKDPEAAGYADSMSADYAESMFLPAIGGILSALGPTLMSLAPQLLSAFGPQLAGLLGSLLGGNRSVTAGQMSVMMGLDEDDAGSDQMALVALSLAMAAATTPDLVFRRVDVVKLAFDDVTPLMVQGKSRFLYRHDQAMRFPLTLETPQPVKKARLQLLVKHAKTLEILIEQNYQIEQTTTGKLALVPEISQEQLKKLAANEDYLVCAAIVWKGRSKKTGQVMTLGTNTMQLITLVGEYSFDRVEGTGETVSLNDVDRFRPYWHKVWQGDFTDELRRMEFQCKYYYTLEPQRTEHARMETVTQVTSHDLAGRKSRLKSGLITSPYALNQLLGQLARHPSLSEAELSAFRSSEFQSRFHHAARTGVKFKGKPGETVALWVYPEVKLQQVVLKKAESTNANGLVRALTEHSVYFPIPAVAHFIGVAT